MAIDRLKRVNELLKREIGTYLFRIIQEPGFDTSSITVTHVITSRNLQNARVLVSILGHEEKREAMLAVLRKHRNNIQKHINANIKLKYTPRLDFKLDTSLESGDHILQILSEIENNMETDPQ